MLFRSLRDDKYSRFDATAHPDHDPGKSVALLIDLHLKWPLSGIGKGHIHSQRRLAPHSGQKKCRQHGERFAAHHPHRVPSSAPPHRRAATPPRRPLRRWSRTGAPCRPVNMSLRQNSPEGPAPVTRALEPPHRKETRDEEHPGTTCPNDRTYARGAEPPATKPG